ncbi:MAG: hypothetical protein FWC11_05510 [Firmicutes bacterium]|nr:hypothetical protein [Bacillota bacterium]
MKKIVRVFILLFVAMLFFVACGQAEDPTLRFTPELPWGAVNSDLFEQKTYTVRMYERVVAPTGHPEAGQIINLVDNPIASGTMTMTIEWYAGELVDDIPSIRLTMEQSVMFMRNFRVHNAGNSIGDVDTIWSEVVFSATGRPIRSERIVTQGIRRNTEGVPIARNFSYRTVARYVARGEEQVGARVYRWRDVEVDELGFPVMSENWIENHSIPINAAIGAFDNEQLFVLARAMTGFNANGGQMLELYDLFDMATRQQADRRGRVSPTTMGIGIGERSPFEINENLLAVETTGNRVYGHANQIYAYSVRISRQHAQAGPPLNIRVSQPFGQTTTINNETGQTTTVTTGNRFAGGDRLILQKSMTIFDVMPQNRREIANVVHTLVDYSNVRVDS